MYKTAAKVVLGSLFSMAAIDCLAEKDRQGWYVGAAFGSIEVSAETQDLAQFDLHDRSFSFGALAGQNFNNWFGLELQHYFTGDLTEDNFDGELNAQYFSVLPKFTIPAAPNLDLFAKFGPVLAILDDDDTWDEGDEDREYNRTEWSDVLFMLGLGVNVEVSPDINLRVAYDFFKGELGVDDAEFVTGGDHGFDLDAQYGNAHLGLYYQF